MLPRLLAAFCYGLTEHQGRTKVLKTIFDFVTAAIGTCLLSPLFVATAVAIKIGDGGPVYFRQERVGKGGRVFKIWKFRTMVVDAERRGAQITVGCDARITKVGHWLRKFKLDEMPQLFNVLCGEMSFVGPRPEVPRYVALYSDEQRDVLQLLPGITDPSSIKYRDESSLLAQHEDPERVYVETVMPDKIHLNLQYAQKATVFTDIGTIFNTLLRVAVPVPIESAQVASNDRSAKHAA